MTNQTLTFKELKKSWWWRETKFRKAKKNFGVPGIGFDYSDESSKRIARNYELMRRAPEGKRFSKSYLDLSRDERTVAHCLWASLPKHEFRLANASRRTCSLNDFHVLPG